MREKNSGINSWKHAMVALGVLVCLIGAFIMWDGSILGENTTGIATVLGITGIGIISRYQRGE